MSRPDILARNPSQISRPDSSQISQPDIPGRYPCQTSRPDASQISRWDIRADIPARYQPDTSQISRQDIPARYQPDILARYPGQISRLDIPARYQPDIPARYVGISARKCWCWPGQVTLMSNDDAAGQCWCRAPELMKKVPSGCNPASATIYPMVGAKCRRAEWAYAIGWLKLGPTVYWRIRRREDAVKTTHSRDCKHTELPRFGALVRR
jgi:hypothetical protein